MKWIKSVEKQGAENKRSHEVAWLQRQVPSSVVALSSTSVSYFGTPMEISEPWSRRPPKQSFSSSSLFMMAFIYSGQIGKAVCIIFHRYGFFSGKITSQISCRVGLASFDLDAKLGNRMKATPQMGQGEKKTDRNRYENGLRDFWRQTMILSQTYGRCSLTIYLLLLLLILYYYQFCFIYGDYYKYCLLYEKKAHDWEGMVYNASRWHLVPRDCVE